MRRRVGDCSRAWGPQAGPCISSWIGLTKATRRAKLALDLGFIPVVPPLKTRLDPWQYNREMYKRRNEVERLFRRLKGYRRIFSRFEKLDAMFLGFLSFVLVADGLRGLC